MTLGSFGLLSLSSPAASASTPAFAFKNYEIGPSNDPLFVNQNCPSSTSPSNCWNWNAEPAIASAPDGSIFASSESLAFEHPSQNCAISGQGTNPVCFGTGAWKSTDGGGHFQTLKSPDTVYAGTQPITQYGGDTAIAVAPEKNLNGYYNVYVVSLSVGLAGVVESTSKDGGMTWTQAPLIPQNLPNPLGIPPAINDRPWVAAFGSSKVCISDHDTAYFAIVDVWCSINEGLTFNQVSPALDANHQYLAGENFLGNLAFDQNNGNIYQVISGVADVNEATVNNADPNCFNNFICTYYFHAMYMAVSTNGGLTFKDYPIYVNASNTKEFFNVQFPNVAVDQAGNVYAAYSDGHNLWYSFSTNHGQSWTGPIKVNKAPSLTAIFPWMAAGAAGKLDIVWYGSAQPGSYTPFSVDLYPPSAQWFVYFAQSQNALSTTSKFTQTVASGPNPIHFGRVCTLGGNCQSYRQLFDDFGVTVNPKTGLATIIYDNARYDPTLTDNNAPNPDCTAQYDDNLICVHSDIAQQTSGLGVFPKHGFNIARQDLHPDVNSQHADYLVVGQNTGDIPITSISVSLAGVSIPLTFNSTFPLQPGSTISSTSVVSLQTIPLLLGTAYPTVITATFDDGFTLSQPSSVVFSLT